MANRSRAVLGHQDLAFVDKYVETMRVEEAYKFSHPDYHGKNAYTLGHATLRRFAVQAAIEVRRAQVAAEMDVTPAEVIRRIMLLGYSDPAQLVGKDGIYLSVATLPESARLAIQSVKVLRTTTQSEGGVTITDQVLLYSLHNKQVALDSLWDKLFKGHRKGNDKMTDEELERQIEANEAALEAIMVAKKSSKLVKSMAKATQVALAEEGKDAKPALKGNGAKKGNGHG